MEDFQDVKQKLICIKKQVYDFLKLQQSSIDPTYFRYSLSGDLWDEKIKWNVQGRVFTLKVAYTIGLGQDDSLVQNALTGMKNFQHADGHIYDDMLLKKKKWVRFKQTIRSGKIIPLIDYEYIRAESRQCYSAMMMYNVIPNLIPICEVRSGEEIDNFLHSLDWQFPWGAGSHFSHLMFFEKLAYKCGQLNKNAYEDNINRAYDWVKHLENKKTGSWHLGTVSAQQAINGAMKVITGLRAVNMTKELTEQQCRRLVDLCLGHINDAQACDNFNIVYVLYYASLLYPDYRRNEVIKFAKERFHVYMEYYFPEYGGFSFLKGSSNIAYYECKITKGRKEPDLHGTALFMWGLFFLSSLLGINDKVALREVVS